MSDYVLWGLITLFVLVMVIAYFVIDLKLRNVNTLSPEIKDCLKKSGKVAVRVDEYDSMIKKNHKKMLFLIILVCFWLLVIFALGLLRVENIRAWFYFCILVFFILLVPLVILALRDHKKFKISDSTYKIQAYVREVQSARSSTYAYLVYYDYVKEKYVITKRALSQEERSSQSIVKGYYVKVLVNERTNRLKYLTIDYS